MSSESSHIVVLGAGFGGLTFCKEFHFPSARVTVVDRQNHHLFQPLLYQVATAGLSAEEIAQPVRSILSNRSNVTSVMDSVVGFDLEKQRVQLEKETLDYDYLVVALGGVTSYYGHPEWAEFAPGLKSLDDALEIRRNLLLAFERAEHASDESEHDKLLTVVVVGGGPTGVELAGAFAELASHVLKGDFRRVDPTQARVVLLEAGPRLLAHLSKKSSDRAEAQLKKMGVEVRTGEMVKSISEGRVELENEVIEAKNIVWAAGVGGSPLAKKLGAETDRAGRVIVDPALHLPENPEVFVIGDMAAVNDQDGKPVPGVSPAAIQMAQHVVDTIEAELESPKLKPERRPFKYWDKGSMATIGRSAAVAEVGGMKISGFPAWLAWLGVHLIFLMGFRNRIFVFLQWVYSYLTYRRGARIIFGLTDEEKAEANSKAKSSEPEKRVASKKKAPARKKRAATKKA